MPRLNPKQLDELVHHLVHRREAAALEKLDQDYPEAGHLMSEHNANLGYQQD